jgi:pimeloyl-ACP methyl ester carboxylesterase
VAQAAADLDALREHVDGPLEGVLGHSFGGKVGLHWASHHADSLGSTWIVDSLPGARPEGRGSETTLQVLDMLEKMTFPVESREAFVQRVQDHGYVAALGHWLAMNLARREDGQYDFGLDLEAIRALLDDYFVQDLWPAVEHWSGSGGLHLVLGEQSDVYSPEDRQRAHSLAAAEPHVHVHTLATGHWVHVEAPKQLAQLLIDRLP